MEVKKYISLVIIAIVVIQCAQEPAFDLLVPYQEVENSYWGYIDFNGSSKINPLFKDMPGMFHEGLAIIETSDGSIDYINKSGQEYEKNYIDATDFQEGIAFAVIEDEYPCLLNSDLEEVKILEKIDELHVPSEGLVCFKNTQGKWGYLNTDCDVVIKPIYDEAFDFSDGLALVKKIEYDTTGGEKNEIVLYGFINAEGNEVIKPTSSLTIIRSFSDGMAAYSDGSDWGWGFIDKTGKKVIRAKREWQGVTDYKQGVASVQVSGLWGLVNREGEIILHCKYDNPLAFSDGLAAVEKDDKIGFINKKGDWIIEPVYDKMVLGFTHRKAIVVKENYYFFINRHGKQISNKEFFTIDFSPLLHSFVRSDFFDIEPVVDTLLLTFESQGINGLSENTTLSEVMKKYHVLNSDLPEDTWSSDLAMPTIRIDDEIDIATSLSFDEHVSKAMTQMTSYYGWYYEETVGYKPNGSAKLNSIKYQVDLSGRKEGKADKLAKGIKKLFEQNNYLLDKELSSDEKYILIASEIGLKATIDFEENNVTIEIEL